MGKTSYFIIGAALGAAAGAVISYLFGPAANTTYDTAYRSRLDWALEEGERTADVREAELRLQLQRARQPRSKPLPDADTRLPGPDLPPAADDRSAQK